MLVGDVLILFFMGLGALLTVYEFANIYARKID
jgi:hypothetical protein